MHISRKLKSPLFLYCIFLTVLNLVFTAYCTVLYFQVVNMTFSLKVMYAYTKEVEDNNIHFSVSYIEVLGMTEPNQPSSVRAYIVYDSIFSPSQLLNWNFLLWKGDMVWDSQKQQWVKSWIGLGSGSVTRNTRDSFFIPITQNWYNFTSPTEYRTDYIIKLKI